MLPLQTWSPEPGNSKAGIMLAMSSDGTSKSFMLAETREVTQAAWTDGSRAWVAAATRRGTFNSTARTWSETSALDEQNTATPAWAGDSTATPQLGPSSQHPGWYRDALLRRRPRRRGQQ